MENTDEPHSNELDLKEETFCPNSQQQSDDDIVVIEKIETLELEDKNETSSGQGEEEEEEGGGEGKKKGRGGTVGYFYPLRPEEPDCVFYVRTASCGFGSNCKFNHPLPHPKHSKNPKVLKTSLSGDSDESQQVVEEKEEMPKKVGQLECKYYLRSGGCKFGKACRYRHPREKSVVGPPAEFNFLGLPIRPGERECPFYMRTGSCKFASNCRFNHPDPTAGGADSGDNGTSSGPLYSSIDSQPAVASWSLPRPSADTVPYSETSRSYVPVMMAPQGAHSGHEWNGYQAPLSPLYPLEGTLRPAVASSMNGSIKPTNVYLPHLQQMPVDEFPERPGQQECQYYVKTGDCKFKSSCRYHHPKARVSKSPNLSPLGLPLRPDQLVCSHFSRYGICKYGAACKYDHSPNHGSSGSPVVPTAAPPQYIMPSATSGGAEASGWD
ncbi:hypothetical protein IFM89_002474 [Coptis chinensis]|uniref:C3H1-type domain-containing protein n=1 Tax=Coptis chinensis TaxID=261450 RepID=A0A835HHY3_9MAGN|nr:hypothetical protein IFM89_002474 [Coptis chinensis]